MDAPLTAPDALIRPWRTATLVASLVAAIELVLLIGAALVLLAKPLAHLMQSHAQAAAFKPAKAKTAPVHHAKRAPVAKPKLARSATAIWVFNGNGVAGAASAEAAKLSGLSYRVRGKGNAKRQDYATTVVMYAPGFQGEATRLARDLRVHVVGPLDGLKRSALHGAQLAVVLGAG